MVFDKIPSISHTELNEEEEVHFSFFHEEKIKSGVVIVAVTRQLPRGRIFFVTTTMPNPASTISRKRSQFFQYISCTYDGAA